MSKSRLRAGPFAMAMLAAIGCSDASGPADRAHLSVRLTDAPGDVHAAVVTISEVYLQGPGGRTTLSSSPVTVDLVTLANTTTDLVNSVEIAAGTYTELRLVVTGAYIEAENGDGSTSIYASSTTYAGLPPGATVAGTLQMPSLAQTGIKVTFDGALELEGDVTLLVDFDVAQSFGRQAGNSGLWVMHPVITGARIEAAASVTASLSLAAGTALPTINGTLVSLASFRASLGGEQLFFADADGDGVFTARFDYVLPGTYSVTIVPPLGVSVTTTPAGPATVNLGAAANQTVSFQVVDAFGLR